MNIYYTYAYLRKDGTPYYIGKGKGKRKFSVSAHNIKPPSDKSRIIILESNLTDIGALALERRYIRWYGRIDLGTGILRNMTDGGDGASGMIISQETRNKISKANTGKKRTPEQKLKYSLNNCNKNPAVRKKRSDSLSKLNYIVTDPNGKIYKVKNLSEFCREHNLLRSSMREIYTGRYSQHKGWHCKLDQASGS